MSSTIEFEGTSVEEAIEKACAALKVEASALDYTVVDEGSGGVFGLGARPVQIKVRVPDGASAPKEASKDTSGEEAPKEAPPEKKKSSGITGPTPEKATQAEEVAKGLLEKMGLDAAVSVRDEHEQIVIVVEEAEGSTDVVEVLGKSRPPAIPSLQFLLNKIVNRFPDDRKHILVEVPAVPRRERKAAAPKASAPAKVDAAKLDPDLDPALVELGQRLADRAKALKKVLTVHPMLASDRRAIHQTVTAIPGVRTVSEGEGLYRKMHIVPDELAGGREKRRRRRRRRKDGEREGGSEGGAEDGDVQVESSESDESAELQETGI